MLIRAITAFIALPGMVAFAIPIWLGADPTFGEEWQAYRARVRRWLIRRPALQ
jgi:protein-S-isoprenylcysteine O-methyltransferase Ste14